MVCDLLVVCEYMFGLPLYFSLLLYIQCCYVDWLIRHIPFLILTLSSVNFSPYLAIAIDL